jgi:Sigma-70, region 4
MRSRIPHSVGGFQHLPAPPVAKTIPLMTDLARPMPRPPAQIAPYVDVFGPDLTVTFLLQFGGAELHLSKTPRATTPWVRLAGQDKAHALYQRAQDDLTVQARIPLAKGWLVAMLAWQGYPNAEIARTLRMTVNSVRNWLKKADGPR